MGGNMGLMPTQTCIAEMKKAFPRGSEVELIFMDDPYRVMPQGLKGTVLTIDDIGTIHVAWKNGSGLGVVWNADVVKNVATGVLSNQFWEDNRPYTRI